MAKKIISSINGVTTFLMTSFFRFDFSLHERALASERAVNLAAWDPSYLLVASVTASLCVLRFDPRHRDEAVTIWCVWCVVLNHLCSCSGIEYCYMSGRRGLTLYSPGEEESHTLLRGKKLQCLRFAAREKSGNLSSVIF